MKKVKINASVGRPEPSVKRELLAKMSSLYNYIDDSDDITNELYEKWDLAGLLDDLSLAMRYVASK